MPLNLPKYRQCRSAIVKSALRDCLDNCEFKRYMVLTRSLSNMLFAIFTYFCILRSSRKDVDVCVRASVGVCMCEWVCGCACAHACVCARVRVRALVRTSALALARTSARENALACKCKCESGRACAHVRICACAHVRVSVRVRVNVRVRRREGGCARWSRTCALAVLLFFEVSGCSKTKIRMVIPPSNLLPRK